VRIHYHTDCYWFSGSESTLLVLLGAAVDTSSVEAEFTYRGWPEYDRGLQAKLDPRVRRRRLKLPDPADLKVALSRGRSRRASRLIRGGISLLPIRQGCLIWDVGRMYAELRRSDADVVHINNGGFPGAISCNATAIAARLAGIPVLYVVNNLAYPYRTPGRVIDYPIDRLVARSVSVFVAGSAEAAARLRSVLRLDRRRQRVIPNAVVSRPPSQSQAKTRESLRVDADTSIALVVARLEKRKGHRYILQALAQLPPPLDGVVLVLAGDGPERAALEHLTMTLGISDRVRFLGDYSDPWSLYAVADVVILPSIGHEDFPIVILEAMAAGRPVVASRIAGIPDQVVDGVTGYVVAPGDPAALGAAVAGVLGTPGQVESMGAAGRSRYETHFAAQLVVEAYWQTYAALISNDEKRRARGPFGNRRVSRA
jgi:glycosyltransferase involved in cell wall biosynthesis